jgi:hypothetical protein
MQKTYSRHLLKLHLSNKKVHFTNCYKDVEAKKYFIFNFLRKVKINEKVILCCILILVYGLNAFI